MVRTTPCFAMYGLAPELISPWRWIWLVQSAPWKRDCQNIQHPLDFKSKHIFGYYIYTRIRVALQQVCSVVGEIFIYYHINSILLFNFGFDWIFTALSMTTSLCVYCLFYLYTVVFTATSHLPSYMTVVRLIFANFPVFMCYCLLFYTATNILLLFV